MTTQVGSSRGLWWDLERRLLSMISFAWRLKVIPLKMGNWLIVLLRVSICTPVWKATIPSLESVLWTELKGKSFTTQVLTLSLNKCLYLEREISSLHMMKNTDSHFGVQNDIICWNSFCDPHFLLILPYLSTSLNKLLNKKSAIWLIELIF